MLAAISSHELVEVSIKVAEGGTDAENFLDFVNRVMDILDERDRQDKNLVFDNAPTHRAEVFWMRL